MEIWDGVQVSNSVFIYRSFKQNGKRYLRSIKSGAGMHIIQLEDIRGETIKTESQTLVQHVLIKESEVKVKNKQKT